MKHTLESRLERARELRKQGYTCSQCVVMVFDDVHNLSEEAAAAVSILQIKRIIMLCIS